MNQNRIIGLDLLRSWAIFCVIAGHFFMHTGFQHHTFEGPSMFIQGTLKFLFGMGVPLFIILTGFLNCRKDASKRYYCGGLRVIGLYLFWSVATSLYLIICEGGVIKGVAMGILSFSTICYGWYIEMWIGLFLLIPFLNILWWNCPSKKHKLLLIGTLFSITSVPIFTNRYGVQLTPDYWRACYPLLFYFVGAYIREYRPKVSRWGWLILAGMCLVNPLFNTLFGKNHSMIQIMGDPSGVFGALLAVLFFMLCYEWNGANKVVRCVLISISLASLDMYLCCYIFDACIYPCFKGVFQWEGSRQAGHYFVLIVPVLFMCAYAASMARRAMTNIIKVVYTKVIYRL